MPVVASATLEVTPVLAGAQQSLTQQLTGASVEAGDKAGQESGSHFASGMAKKIAAGSVAVAGAVTAVGGALVATAGKTAAYGDQIDKASQKLGVSSTFYQEWEAVLQHSGTSMDSMGGAFKRLATASQDASADQQAAFEKLGMSMDEVSQMSPEELFTNVISGLQGMENGTERTAVATELLGKGAMEMGALLNTSAEDTQAMIDKVHDLGGVMSEDAVKASAQYQDSLQNMQTAFAGIKNGIGAQLLPALSGLMDGVADFVTNADLSPLTDTIGKAVTALSDFITNLDIEAAGKIFQNVVVAIGNVVGLAWDVIQTIFSSLKEGLGTITRALTDTGTNWGEVWNGISAVISEVAEIIGQVIGIIAQVIADLVVQAQTQGTFFNAVWQGICVVVQGAADVIKDIIDFVSALLSGDWASAWQAARDIVTTINNTISKFLQACWKAIRAVALVVWKAIKEAISKPIQQAKRALQTAWNNIRATASNAWNALKSAASKTWNAIKTAVTTPIDRLKSALSTAWENIKSVARSAWNAIKNAITTPIENAKSMLSNAWNAIKNTASTLWNSIKSAASSIWRGVKTAVMTPIGNLKSALSTAWSNIKSTAASAWKALKEKITKPIKDAKDKIKDTLDKVKGFFPLRIGKIFSNLKIPKISVKGGKAPFGIGGLGTAPSISVTWHRKALVNPFMFQNATLFGAGEAGDEILYGRENLLRDIREATGGGGYTQNITINSPKQLNPSEIARQTRNQTRSMVMRMRTA